MKYKIFSIRNRPFEELETEVNEFMKFNCLDKETLVKIETNHTSDENGTSMSVAITYF